MGVELLQLLRLGDICKTRKKDQEERVGCLLLDFYTMLLEYYDTIFPLQKERLSFFIDLAKKRGLERILDIGCSTGTYVLELSQRGYDAVGIDVDLKMIEKARGRAQRRGLAPSFLKGDIREVQGLFQEEFHLLTCCGNTLAHLTSYREIKRAIREMKKVLLPGGTLVVQIVNYDRVLKEAITALPKIVREGLLFEREYSFKEDGLIDFRGILTTNEGRVESLLQLYPLKLAQLRDALEEAGLVDLTFYHDFKYTLYRYREGAPLGLVGVAQRGP